MGNVSGSITQSGTTATTTGGSITLSSDEIEKTKIEAVMYDTALSTVNRVTFTVPSPGGSYSFKIKAPTLPNTNWAHAGSVAVMNFLGQSTPSTVTFSQQPASIDEGSEGTFQITTTGLEKGTALQWSLIHVGDISKSFHYDTSSAYGIGGAVILDNSSSPKGTFKVKPVEDETTTPTGKQKQFKIEIKRNDIIVATSNIITVNDTSKGPVYSLTLSPTSLNEGEIVTGTITATDPSSVDQSLRWGLVEISSPYDSAASNYFDTQGTVIAAAGTGAGTFTINIKADNLDNPTPKTFKVMLYDSSGVPLLNSAVGPVTVNDTSKTPGPSASSGTVSLSSVPANLYSFNTGALTLDAGYGIAFFSDGRFSGLGTDGTRAVGNWYTPTTTNIGNNYYISLTSTAVADEGSGGDHSDDIEFQQLTFANFYAGANGYRCVDPETPILVDQDGTTKLAGNLIVGEHVYTMHEHTKMWGYYTITNLETAIKSKVLLTFNDGTTLKVSDSHKIYMGKDKWFQIPELKPGDLVVSHSSGMKEITSIEPIGEGSVVSMEIEHAHTYVANDIISHNIKARVSSGHWARYERLLTIKIFDKQDPSGLLATTTVNIGGQVGIEP